MSAAPHIPSELVLRIASYFTPIHHVAGRLRVRVSSEIKKEADSLPLEKIDQTIKQIDGIKNVKFNKLIGSATIEYDNEIFPKKIWDRHFPLARAERISTQTKETRNKK